MHAAPLMDPGHVRADGAAGEILIVAPTVMRGSGPGDGYLLQTATRLAEQSAGARTEFLVLNASVPSHHHGLCAELGRRAEARIPPFDEASVRIETAVDAAAHYETQSHARRLLRETPLTPWHRWAGSYCLDYALALRLARRSSATYFLVVEDDVTPVPGWPRAVLTAAARRLRRWPHPTFIALYSPDLSATYEAAACALLFRNDESIDALVVYLEQSWQRAPLDHLLRDFARGRRRPAFVLVPSLFQHVGLLSSQAPARDGISPEPRRSPTFPSDRTSRGPARLVENLRIALLRARWWLDVLRVRLLPQGQAGRSA